METQPLLIKKGWLRALFFFISFFIIVALFDLIGILIVSQFSEYGFEEFISDPELIMQNKMMLLMMFCQLLGTLFTVWIFQTFVNKESFASIGLRLVNYEKDLFQGLLAGGVLISSGFLILFVFKLIKVDLTYFSFYDQIFYLFLFIIVSLNEEIAIRAVSYTHLTLPTTPYV